MVFPTKWKKPPLGESGKKKVDKYMQQSSKEKFEDWVKKAAESGYLFVPAPEEGVDENVVDENETLPLENAFWIED